MLTEIKNTQSSLLMMIANLLFFCLFSLKNLYNLHFSFFLIVLFDTYDKKKLNMFDYKYGSRKYIYFFNRKFRLSGYIHINIY